MLECDAEPGGVFLLNTPYAAEEVLAHLPLRTQQQILDKRLKFYVINADSVARESGMGKQNNTVLQVCFFAIADVLPKDGSHRRDQGVHRKKLRQKRRRDRPDESAARWMTRRSRHLHEVEIARRRNSTARLG